MTKFTTEPRPTPTPTRRARGNAWETRNGADRYCETCGAPFTSRKPWARYCSPTCRAHAHDAKTGRRARLGKP